MSISAPFIHRPVATTLLTVAIALAGGVAFKFLPVSPLPQVEFPTISVSAGLPGASPDTMASSVATPLERQFGRIAGITEMTSTSSLGLDQHHDPVRLEPQYRRRRTRRPGGDQRGARTAACQPAQQSFVSQGQPGGRADLDSLVDVGHRRARADVRHRARRSSSRSSPRFPESDRSLSAAGLCRPCAWTSIRRRSTTTDWGSRTFGPRSPPPTSTGRRGR